MKIKLLKELKSGEDTLEVGTVIEVSDEYAAELKSANIGEDYTVPINKDISIIEAEAKEIKDKVESKKIIDDGKIEVGETKDSKETMLHKSLVLAKSRATNNWNDDARKFDAEEKAILGQGEATNVGGALVTDQIANGIFDVAMETSVVASKAQSQPIAQGYNSLTVRQNKSTTATAASYKGLVLSVIAEGATITPASTVGYTLANASVNKIIALNYQTNELIEDVPGLTGNIEGLVGEAFGLVLDDEIINGTRSLLTPLVGDLSVATVAAVGAGDVTPAILNEFISKAINPARSEWFMSGETFYNVVQGLTDASNRRLVQPMLADPIKQTLLGYPVNIVSCMQAAAQAKVDIMFGSIGDGYIIGTKGGPKFAKSIHLEYLTDQTAYRWVLRVAGLPTVYSKITLADGRTVSPVVSIARS